MTRRYETDAETQLQLPWPWRVPEFSREALVSEVQKEQREEIANEVDVIGQWLPGRLGDVHAVAYALGASRIVG